MISFIYILLSCNVKDAKENRNREALTQKLDSIMYQIKQLNFSLDTLVLVQEDEKCGEWGGNQEKIKIFYDSLNNLSGYYSLEIHDCDNLEGYINNPTRTDNTKNKVITPEDLSLLESCIKDLVDYKMTTPYSDRIGGNSGILNEIRIENKNHKDTTLESDWPSFNWVKFHKLKARFFEK